MAVKFTPSVKTTGAVVATLVTGLLDFCSLRVQTPRPGMDWMMASWQADSTRLSMRSLAVSTSYYVPRSVSHQSTTAEALIWAYLEP